ncbi:hypothetical protein BPC006_I3617 [Burkholderia pseudomallei BPC006]|nr:hypothetical protein BPC006_I3617 [Burkholderia pseudomallei BPC006]
MVVLKIGIVTGRPGPDNRVRHSFPLCVTMP